jgi:hydroxyacylglutathione hydrolase
MPGNTNIRVARKVVGPLSTNCYLLTCHQNGETVIVDPGGDIDLIEEYITQSGLEPVKIVCTHGHSDHIAGVAELKKRYGIPFAIHQADIETIKQSVEEAPMWGMGNIEQPSVDQTLAHGNTIKIGNSSVEIRHTPGHSPGSISLIFGTSALVGDTLFAGSIGRTDFKGGNFDTLINSIKQQLLTLPDETVVYCGHGPNTIIGRERKTNPYLI